MRRSINDTNLVTLTNPKSPISEAYRTLRTNIQYSAIDTPIQVVMVVSTQMDEGKTTTITNLAIAYAQEGKRVLLIDADMRKPSIHHVFSLTNRVGLSSILSNQFNVQDVISDTTVDNLSIISAGPIPPNPSEMLGSQKLKVLVAEMREYFDMILFDTPPIMAVTDSLILSALCDGVVLVVQAGKVKKDLVKKTKASLQHVNAPILGTVLNNVAGSSGKIYHDYYAKK
ncbi:CpsD/CapB family tyrosine-protein kinase [Paenibacillus sp. GCM10012307]|uniref:non-specific protein-tyrosine kinase n=1 Tax=Paenibacillus roseus TaxID=2798579 RepID=A0A934MTP5_9BACL|nr:CpsD/CapB family tyrosine-protein kinase [Paenibacillus roseus]MBJ6360267.1 CpsD/CapB family tyrosine-protein kinase [Paenibacillus roseus]